MYFIRLNSCIGFINFDVVELNYRNQENFFPWLAYREATKAKKSSRYKRSASTSPVKAEDVY